MILRKSLSAEELESADSNIKENFSILNREFCIVIPAYNEESRIGPVLHDVAEFISRNTLPWHVIVSIDGNDGTENIVGGFSKRYGFILPLKSGGRNGKGGAIARSVPYISGEFVILMDADNSIVFSEIVKRIPLIADSTAVILSRYDGTGNIPFLRRFLSRGFNTLVRALTGLRVDDTQSGYKIFRADAFVNAMGRVGVTNTSYDISLLYHIMKSGGRIVESQSPYRHDDGSKFNPLGEVMGQGISLIAFGVRHSRFYKYVPERLIRLYYRKFRWI